MTDLVLDRVRKAYGDTPVLDGISLQMAANEFVAFLGPSGSGKSTLLRIVAGLETADAGEVHLGGRRIDQLAPGDRGVAMVFQHYALYPHMTVRDNMAFGLRNARVPRDEIDTRIAQASEILEIEPLLERKPGQLSGGQRQRVAIGRAIIKQPALFLLDEPLSNLDAALRSRTRVELARLRQRVEAGIIMVTHDQAEAMTLADRIVVMNDRRIQQVGTPMEIYARPANAFVAQFVGTPAMTLLAGTIDGEADGFAVVRLADGVRVATRARVDGVANAAPVRLGVRPEHVTIGAVGSGTVDAEVILVERLGDRSLVHARVGGGQDCVAQDRGDSRTAVGDRVALRIDGAAAHIFTADDLGHHPEPQA